jgi:putative methionine-R-sulfoxide reductase with GAF domain
MLRFDQELLEIYGELERDRLIALVVRYARDRLGAGGSSVFLRDDITGRYVLRGTTGLQEGAKMPAERVEYEPGEGLTGWIAEHGRPLRIANVKDSEELRHIAEDLVWSKKYSEISAKPGQAYLGVPILSRDGATVLGVLRVSGKAEGEHFDEQDEALLSHVAAMVCIAIENSQRYEREKRRARYFWLLLDIGTELDPRRPIGEMLQAVVNRGWFSHRGLSDLLANRGGCPPGSAAGRQRPPWNAGRQTDVHGREGTDRPHRPQWHSRSDTRGGRVGELGRSSRCRGGPTSPLRCLSLLPRRPSAVGGRDPRYP